MNDLQPLASNFKIVDESGFPTQYFIQWAQQRQIDISGGITAAQAQQLIDDWATARDIHTTAPISGGGSLASDLTLTHDDSGVLAGTYGDAAHVAQFAVDEKGHITAAMDIPISGGGGGGLVKLDEIITSASQASAIFAAIPTTYRQLRLVVVGRTSSVINTVRLMIQLNGDTGANYDWFEENRFGSGGANGATFMFLGALVGTLVGAGYAAANTIDFSDANGATFFKPAMAKTQILQSGGTMFSETYSAWWRSVADITDMVIAPETGNFIDGSILTLYGIA